MISNLIKSLALIVLTIVMTLKFILSLLRLDARRRANQIRMLAEKHHGTQLVDMAKILQPKLDAAAWRHEYRLDVLLTWVILLNLAARIFDLPELGD